MLLAEYNEEETMRMFARDAREDTIDEISQTIAAKMHISVEEAKAFMGIDPTPPRWAPIQDSSAKKQQDQLLTDPKEEDPSHMLDKDTKEEVRIEALSEAAHKVAKRFNIPLEEAVSLLL